VDLKILHYYLCLIKTDRKFSLDDGANYYNYNDNKLYLPNLAFNYKIKDNINFGFTASVFKLSDGIGNNYTGSLAGDFAFMKKERVGFQ